MGTVLGIDLLRGERLMGRYRFTEAKHQLIKIGKIPSAHIFLEGPQVSRLHAVIEFRDDGPWVVDMGTMSGTEVNGQRIERQRLEDGDTIGIGDEVLAVSIKDDGPKQAYQPQATREDVVSPIPTVRVKQQPRKIAVTNRGDTPDEQRKATDRYPSYARAVEAAGGFTGKGSQRPAPVPATDLVRTTVARVPDLGAAETDVSPASAEPSDLHEKIQRLPPAKRVQVEDFVDYLFWLDSERYPQALQQELLGVGQEAAQNLRQLRRSTDVLVTSFKKEQRMARVVGAAAVAVVLIIAAIVYGVSPDRSATMRTAAVGSTTAADASGATDAHATPGATGPAGTSIEPRDEARFVYVTLTAAATPLQLATTYFVRPRWADLIAEANPTEIDRGLTTTISAGRTVRIPRYLSYTVQPNQSLSWIAKQLLGDAMQYEAIYQANRAVLHSPTAVEVGMVLKVPILKPGSVQQ